ncbi:MAG: HDOD domain-containing protein [bacterium]
MNENEKQITITEALGSASLRWLFFSLVTERFHLNPLTDQLSRGGEETDFQPVLAEIAAKINQRLKADETVIVLYEDGDSEAPIISGCDKLTQEAWFERLQLIKQALSAGIESESESIVFIDELSQSIAQDSASGNLIASPIKLGGLEIGFVAALRATSGFSDEEGLKLLHWAEVLSGICERVVVEAEHETKIQSFAHALSAALDARDPLTSGHSMRVAMYAMAILNELDQYEAQESSWNVRNRVRIAALLHDMGKVGIPDCILLKPDSLTDEEFEMIRQHPVIGAEVLTSCHGFKDLVAGVLYHHEHFDGSGYPFGLKGNEIPFIARLIALADAFDAITSDRPFRKASTHEEAIEIITKEVQSRYDPLLIDALLKAYKKGTLTDVRLPYQLKGVSKPRYDDIESIYGKHLKSIPSLPTVLERIRQLLGDPEVSLREVAKVLSSDEGLASRVLKLVNSAYYGLPHMVGTIPLATTILGAEAIRSHVVNIAYIELMNNLATGFEEYNILWSHALRTAVWARELARKWATVDCEEAFTAGLIHDIGKVLCLRLKGGAYARIVVEAYKSGKPLVGVEKEIVGFDHTKIGAWAVEKWNLPATLVDAVANHHDPSVVEGEQYIKELVKTIHIADIAARAMDSTVIGFIPFIMLELNPMLFKEMGSQSLIEIDTIKDKVAQHTIELESTFTEVMAGEKTW